jgi:hypothetical protein
MSHLREKQTVKAIKTVLLAAALTILTQPLLACDIWGPKRSGKAGLMDADDIYVVITKLVGTGTKLWQKNAKKAAEAIVNHTERSGGGTNYQYKGKTVFHVSEGKKSDPKEQIISVFFTCKGSGEANSIVGIGRHIGPASYEIEWHAPAWNVGNKLP